MSKLLGRCQHQSCIIRHWHFLQKHSASWDSQAVFFISQPKRCMKCIDLWLCQRKQEISTLYLTTRSVECLETLSIGSGTIYLTHPVIAPHCPPAEICSFYNSNILRNSMHVKFSSSTIWYFPVLHHLLLNEILEVRKSVGFLFIIIIIYLYHTCLIRKRLSKGILWQVPGAGEDI